VSLARAGECATTGVRRPLLLPPYNILYIYIYIHVYKPADQRLKAITPKGAVDRPERRGALSRGGGETASEGGREREGDDNTGEGGSPIDIADLTSVRPNEGGGEVGS
jgi:hypothetical protein